MLYTKYIDAQHCSIIHCTVQHRTVQRFIGAIEVEVQTFSILVFCL